MILKKKKAPMCMSMERLWFRAGVLLTRGSVDSNSGFYGVDLNLFLKKTINSETITKFDNSFILFYFFVVKGLCIYR